MRVSSELGKWIREKYDTQAAFGDKIGVRQGRVSKWILGTEGISPEYQRAVRKLGYSGPWPVEEAQDTQAGGPAPYVTRDEFLKWTGRIERLEEGFEKLGEVVRLLLQEREEARQAGRK